MAEQSARPGSVLDLCVAATTRQFVWRRTTEKPFCSSQASKVYVFFGIKLYSTHDNIRRSSKLQITNGDEIWNAVLSKALQMLSTFPNFHHSSVDCNR